MSTKTLRMLFTDSEGRTRAISMQDPVETPAAAMVEATMDHIIATDLFKPQEATLVGKVRAEIVERTVDTVFDPS